MQTIRYYANRANVVSVVCRANKVRKPEVYYQRILETHLNGRHMKLDCGVTDITTDHLHAEIKEWKKWKEAVGQLLSYNVCEKRSYLRLYLFDQYPKSNKNTAMKIFMQFNIHPFEFIEEGNTIFIRDMVSGENIMIKNKQK